MGFVESQALQQGLKAGGVTAAVPLVIEGVMAMTPQAREERKINREMRQDALNTLERGKKHGFGPSRARRNQQVMQQMAGYNRQEAPARDTLERQESLLGIGRSGAIQDQRKQMAEAKGNFLGATRAQVEDQARLIGQQREKQAHAQLNQERAVLANKNAQRKAAVTGALQTGVSVGFGSARAHQDRLREDTWRQDQINMFNAAMGNAKRDPGAPLEAAATMTPEELAAKVRAEAAKKPDPTTLGG